MSELAKALEEPENKHLKALKPYMPNESEDEDDFLDPLYHEAQAKVSSNSGIYLIWRVFAIKGVVLDVGDVIRLGRVCYIVKESSIELGEQALKMCESYAQSKTKKWDEKLRSQNGSNHI